MNLFNCIFYFKIIKNNKKRVLYYRALMWRSAAMWRRADERTYDTGTRVCACVRDTHVCA